MKLRKVKKQKTRSLAELEAELARRDEEIRSIQDQEAAFRAKTERLLQDMRKSLKAVTPANHRMLVGILQERVEVFLSEEGLTPK